jgi:hypothetical protein
MASTVCDSHTGVSTALRIGLSAGVSIAAVAVATLLTAACGGGSNTTPTAPTPPPAAPPATAGRFEVTIAGDGVSQGGILYRPETPSPVAALIVLHGWQSAGTNGAAVVEARARRFSDEG